MATITVTPTNIEITFTTAQKLGGLVRDQRIPRTAVKSVAVVEDGYGATTGLRAPGLGIPGRRKLGTWRSRGRRHLVDVRRGEPAVRIELTGQHYDTLVIGTPAATSVAAELA
jgi:hypothetical protein